MNSTTEPALEMAYIACSDQCVTACPERRRTTVGYGFTGQEPVIGPAKLLPVQTGQKVTGSVSYFYTEDAPGTTYDNFLIATDEGNTRQTQWLSGDARSPYSHASRLRGPERRGVINHYYPYGLRISGLNGISEDYLNMYTSKELQTGEFDQDVSSGLEMPAPSGHAIHHTHASRQTCVTISGYDFHARFGACPERSRRNPQLGRWFAPDPAEQFSNPYLAMGNNPVMYVDPDGEFVLAAVLIGAAISGTVGYIGGKRAGLEGGDLFAYTLGSAVIGGISGGVGASVGAGVSASLSIGGFAGGAIAGAAGGAAGGFVGGFYGTALNNSTFGTNHNVFMGGLKAGVLSASIGAVVGGTISGIAESKATSQLDKLLAEMDRTYYEDQLFADIAAANGGKYGVAPSAWDRVDFSGPNSFRDVLQKLRFLQAHKNQLGGEGSEVSNHFNLKTISVDDGWSRQGMGSEFWSKTFHYKDVQFDVRAPNYKLGHLKIHGILGKPGSRALSIGAVDIHDGNLVWINFANKGTYQSAYNYVFQNQPWDIFNSRTPPIFIPNRK